MTKEEALKNWKEEVAKWDRIGKIEGWNCVDYKVSFEAFITFIEILDALIAPEEHAQKTEENKHDPETCTEKADKSTNRFEMKIEFEENESYPFICSYCQRLYDCDIAINNICVCPSCDENLYYLLLEIKKYSSIYKKNS